MLNPGNEFRLKHLTGFDFNGCELATFANQQIHFIIDFMQIFKLNFGFAKITVNCFISGYSDIISG